MSYVVYRKYKYYLWSHLAKRNFPHSHCDHETTSSCSSPSAVFAQPTVHKALDEASVAGLSVCLPALCRLQDWLRSGPQHQP